MITLLGQGVQIDPVRALVVLACLCWLILLTMFFPYWIVRSIYRRFWIDRGLKPDGIYCAACRFDVRGATNEHCPECGAHLLASVGLHGSRLGILARGLHPPGGYVYRASFYVLAGFFLSFSAVMLVGKLLPINYEPWLYVGLDRLGRSHPDIIVITVDAERSWTNEYVFQRAASWQADYHTEQAFNLSEDRDEVLIHAIWEDVVSKKPLSLPVHERDTLKEEFVAVFQAACDFDEQRARESVDLFDLDWEMYHRAYFHPWYTALGFLCVIATLIYLLNRAQRDLGKANEAYLERLDDMFDQYQNLLAGKHAAPTDV